ncbi:MAG: D-glycero-beta-D-manno-heptose 1-phosphate adenylyltransferase [Bacteroidetes bacterium]|nr:D-glycero-beta-D-manno-heptose 1-phosphate adenylyltransferase [Bacteroidota bacterium]MBS1629059.1 D-glycero-beta-D-manno-heptose 1-phosphate adenylyltransferase [Bacteroidota bacterium]
MTDKLQWIQARIHNRASLAKHVAALKASGQSIVFTNGCFDILHRGHLDYLAKAAALGNALVIGVNSDTSVQQLKGPSRPINNEQDRLFGLASLLFVNAVCLFDEDTPLELIQELKPDVLAKGGDYTMDTIVGAKEMLARGACVEIIPFVEGYSTTALIEKIKQA